MTAKPLNTGFVALSVHYTADPIGWTQDRIDATARRLGGRGSWKWRKEMEMDANAQSGESVFDPDWLDIQERKHIKPPLLRMEIGQDDKLYEHSTGRIRIWIKPDQMPRDLPQGTSRAELTFGVGIDVGAGTGQSNSTVEVFATQGMEQAAEFASSGVSPTYLGHVGVAIARFFNDALICCVQKMHGITTIRAMTDDCGYTNLWRNVSHDKMVETQTGGRIGWVQGENSQALLMNQMGASLERASGGVDVLSTQSAIIHSFELLEELRQYIYDDAGRPTLSRTRTLNAAARKSHGDRVIGTATSMQACMDLPPWRNAQAASIKPNTIEWFMERHRKADQKDKTKAWQ
jgi:hypothetical protein